MPRSAGIAVPPSQAEAMRRRLQAEGRLRADLKVKQEAGTVVFPVDGEGATFEFEARQQRAPSYRDLVDLPADERERLPRAFDAFGDIAIIKVPEDQWAHHDAIGQALLQFLPGCRAVFHDRGVKGDFRVRELVRIAGEGGSETTVSEYGITLHTDPGRAYFSPRLADERDRVARLVQPRERVIDLFGGVGPFAVRAAKAGAEVVCIDLNPAACTLARRNAAANGVTMEVLEGDARVLAPKLDQADRVMMNLPHDALAFLDVAATVSRPGTMIHLHAIIPGGQRDAVGAEAVQALAQAGRHARVAHVRHVRDYSTLDAHFAYDLEVTA